ncbi:hypothetical protein EV182_003550, partial [Spiromyces aspiralis]
MDGTPLVSSVTASQSWHLILDRVLPYLPRRELSRVQLVCRDWWRAAKPLLYKSVRGNLYQLPIRIEAVNSMGAARFVTELVVDLTYSDLYSSIIDYERRVASFIDLACRILYPSAIKKLTIVYSTPTLEPTQDVSHSCARAFRALLAEFRHVPHLDLSQCEVCVIRPAATGPRPSASPFAPLDNLRALDWFSMGANDYTSASLLFELVVAHRCRLEVLKSRGDTTNALLEALCSHGSSTSPLRVLDISNSMVTDRALARLLCSSPHLEHLNLSCCSRLTSATLEHIQPDVLPRLRYLSLHGLSIYMSDLGLVFNARNQWPHLHTLYLRCTARPGPMTTNADATAVVVVVPPSKTHSANDAILKAISRNCPRIVSLHLLDCRGVSDSGLRTILANLGSLRTIVALHHASERPIPVEEQAAGGDDNSSNNSNSPVAINATDCCWMLGSVTSAMSSGSQTPVRGSPAMPAAQPGSSARHQNRRHSLSSVPDFPPLPSNATPSIASPPPGLSSLNTTLSLLTSANQAPGASPSASSSGGSSEESQ